ncbi:acyloxyacyl hydrolase [Microbulbifer guangxiensis]|uniref:acyloxyacyl hydrolase n=1 Tax=Microbulbifer guangxiensis TaxID=2904249 RepID=UPI001F1EA050|nr:acyloxyacyl hydrolase [Microbulbifer guangxiensis]
MTPAEARAEQEVIFSAGKGLGDALIQRDSIASAEMAGINFATSFAEFPLTSGLWQWWAQGSYSHLRLDHRGERQKQNVFELKPVLRWYPRARAEGFFGEAGVGAAYLSDKHFGDIELTTHGNFALHFAAGYRLHSGAVASLRYSHFSNAYTNTPNPGFDFASLNWHFNF